MKLQEHIDNFLQAEEDKKKDRQRSGKWSPSLFGRCYRLQFYNRKGLTATNPPDKMALRNFMAGRLFHNFVQKMIPSDQIEVAINQEDVFGFADVVLENEVIDIKSVRSFAMKKMKKAGYDIEADKLNYILQVMAYTVFLNKPRGRLVMIDKDSMEIKEFEFETAMWRNRVEEELEILRSYWKRDRLPPAIARAYNGKDCDYCVHRDRCKREEAENGVTEAEKQEELSV